MSRNIEFLEVRDMYLAFAGNMVLKGLNLSVKKGEIHAIMGQNATGKSSLVRTLSGQLRMTSGTIMIDDVVYDHMSLINVERHKIHTINQELNLFENLSVLENIFIRDFDIFLSGSRLRKRYLELQKELNMPDFDPNARVSRLSIGLRRMVEFIRAYVYNPRLLILDEPDAFLSAVESKQMMKIIRMMQKRGTTVLYVSHKITEAVAVAERVSIIYDGINIKTFESDLLGIESIVDLIAGRSVQMRFPKVSMEVGAPLLSVEGVSAALIQDLSFKLHQKEILGITGISGAGKTHIGRLIVGLQKPDKGRIFFHPSETTICSISDAIEAGIGYISEESEKNFVPYFNASRNITLPKLEKICKGSFVNEEDENIVGSYYAKALNLRGYMPDKWVCFYSGGEKQKMNLAKMLFSDTHVMVMDEPTKYVDIPSKSDIYNMFSSYVARGNGIVLLSSDFSEICGMCDRILVINNGKLVKVIHRKEADEQKIAFYAMQ